MRTARPLQGAQPGDMYTVLVEAQYEGTARQWWGLWEEEWASGRQIDGQDRAFFLGSLLASTLSRQERGVRARVNVSL